jgi:hypothetical protein
MSDAKVHDKWEVIRGWKGLCKGVRCNGHDIDVNHLSIDYEPDGLPALNLKIQVLDFEFIPEEKKPETKVSVHGTILNPEAICEAGKRNKRGRRF